MWCYFKRDCTVLANMAENIYVMIYLFFISKIYRCVWPWKLYLGTFWIHFRAVFFLSDWLNNENIRCVLTLPLSNSPTVGVGCIGLMVEIIMVMINVYTNCFCYFIFINYTQYVLFWCFFGVNMIIYFDFSLNVCYLLVIVYF